MSNGLSDERLLFEALKAHREWYLVEYHPPIHGHPFATVGLTLLGSAEPQRVATAMEYELTTWLQRYPVPIMVSSFTDTGDLYHLEPVRNCDHLIGWLDPVTRLQVAHWRIVPSQELPAVDLTPSALRRLYHGVPYRSSNELQQAAVAKRRSLRVGAGVVFGWLVVVPAAIALIEFNSPEWLAWLMLFYSLSQAYIAALRLWGMWPKTQSETAVQEEERRMRHHHYHCERNPEGFRRLVAENIERESREQIQREAAELKR